MMVHMGPLGDVLSSLVRLLNLFLGVLNFLSVVANSSHHWGELGNKLKGIIEFELGSLIVISCLYSDPGNP